MSAPSWLKKAIFYEIYPQSFYDSNADGIGDLQGIIQKLDYIRNIGFNAIWLNPCFVSPFADAGYDVSDYYNIAPRYGSNEDMKDLLKKAHSMNIKICLDLVPGHTSIEHPWFIESSKIQAGKFTNRYIWTDDSLYGNDGGLKTVSGLSQRDGSYIVNFFSFQPALNYGFENIDPEIKWQLPTDHSDCKATVEELKNIMRFWLDMGVDGFRVDMAASLVKNDPDQSGTIRLWKDIHSMLGKDYPEAAMISEWGCPENAIKAGFDVDFLAHFGEMVYNLLFMNESSRTFKDSLGHSFFDKAGKGDIKVASEIIKRHYESIKGKGYFSIPSGNHDIGRLSIGRSKEELEVAFAFLMTMPGVPFVYYGDEIGMPYSNLPNKEGGYKRTGSRTPMHWSKSVNMGFSSGPADKLYLPVADSEDSPDVESQSSEPNSLLQKVKNFIAMRKSIPALSNDGEFEVLYAMKNEYPFIYQRSDSKDTFVIIINPSGQKQIVEIDFKITVLKYLAGQENVKIENKDAMAIVKVSPISYAIIQTV